MCCITEAPTKAAAATVMPPLARRSHRKAASMDSFFLATAFSRDNSTELTFTLRIVPSPRKEVLAAVPPDATKCEEKENDPDDCTSTSDASPATALRSTAILKKKKSVRFSTVRIRVHSLVIGDSPSCTTGVPLSLGWDYNDDDAAASPSLIGINAYERFRERSRRTCSGNAAASELQLSRRRRMDLLAEVGGYSYRELVREERRLRMKERDEFFGRTQHPALVMASLFK